MLHIPYTHPPTHNPFFTEDVLFYRKHMNNNVLILLYNISNYNKFISV